MPPYPHSMVRSDSRAEAGARPVDGRADSPGGGDDGGGAAALNAMAKEAIGKDPGAVRRFLTRIAPTIRRVCRGAMGRDHPDLEDAIQDCLFETMRALPRYRFEGNVIHYVAKISIRLAIAARRRGTARSGKLQALDEQPPAADLQHESSGAGIEISELVRQIVSNLSRNQAETLILRMLLGFSIEEIASITAVPINTVKTRLRLGKKTLRRRLEHQAHAPLKAQRSP
jgi:RNA polymerase sigma-70 factor (ECF subfamily)